MRRGTYPRRLTRLGTIQLIYQGRSYNIHRQKLRAIKLKKHSVNSSLVGTSELTFRCPEISRSPGPRHKPVPFFCNQRENEIYVENQHLVRRIADINRRTKSVFICSLTHVRHITQLRFRAARTAAAPPGAAASRTGPSKR